MENGLPKLGYLPMTFKYNWGFFLDIVFRDWSKSIGVGGGGGVGRWAGAFGNVVDKKHMAQPLPSAQND